MGEGLGRAIPGVAFLRTRVFRNAHPEDHPPRALSPLRPRSLTFTAAFDTVGGVQEAGVFTCVDAEAERNAWPRVLRTDGRTDTHSPRVHSPFPHRPASARAEGGPFRSHPSTCSALSRTSL